MISYDSLPPALKAQVAALGGNPKGRKAKKGGGSTAYRGRCSCGEVFDGTRGKAAWEKHADETGCRRFECDLSPRCVPG